VGKINLQHNLIPHENALDRNKKKSHFQIK
jgi:hypothetical protein